MSRNLVAVFFLSLLGTIAVHCQSPASYKIGAEQLDVYLPKLKDKQVGMMVNQTSLVGSSHLVDLLLTKNIKIQKIFAPEHGFRGNAPDGEVIKDGVDVKTGLTVVSLYGSSLKSMKATPEQMADVDVVIYDIQDVGARFFTYTSSLTYLMESCAENNKKLIVLDRGNPNDFVDGPIMQSSEKSFVGMHPIPIAYGLTIGEFAQMLNGEGWLDGGKKCELEVIKLTNYAHGDAVQIMIAPSPNLPNAHGVALYPSTCLFEGTALSIGRGTYNPFEFVGHPDLKNQPFEFTPVSIPGMSTQPKLENKVCYGLDLRNATPDRKVSLKYLIDLYQQFPDKDKFFIGYIDKLAGDPGFKEQIKKGMTEDQIRETWKADLDKYKLIRKKYLLYKDNL